MWIPMNPKVDQMNCNLESFVYQNPYPTISFHCQNPLPNDLYSTIFLSQKTIAVVRAPHVDRYVTHDNLTSQILII